MTDSRYLVVSPPIAQTTVLGKKATTVAPAAPQILDLDAATVLRMRQLGWTVTFLDNNGVPDPATLNGAGTVLSGLGALPGSTVTVFVNGTASGTAVATSAGAWTYTFGSKPSTGAIITHAIVPIGTDARYLIVNPTAGPMTIGKTGTVVAAGASAYVDIDVDTYVRLKRLGWYAQFVDNLGNPYQPTPNATGLIYGGYGALAGSTVTVYVAGAQVGTATASGSGTWSYTFGSKPTGTVTASLVLALPTTAL